MPDTAVNRSFAARALPWVLWALTFHILAIALLFGYFQLPMKLVRVIAGWKEAAALLLFAVVGMRAMTGRGPRVTVTPCDLFAALWIALSLVFFATENVVLRDLIPFKAAIFGVRDASFFVIFYFVGRGTPELADDHTVMRHAFLVLAVTAGIAILEQLLVTPQILVALGVASYIQNFLGGVAFTQGNTFGLPDNYWTQMGGHFVRRSGSVFLSSQGFAVVFVVLIPFATMWLLRDPRRTRWLDRVWYMVIWAGLIVTFTRTAIFVSAIEAAAIFATRRRVTGAALAVSVGVIALVGVMAVSSSASTFIFETITWQTGSSASHLKDWTQGVVAFLQQPWGYGLGTTDQTAVRAGLDPITADNLYLKYAVELGLPGLVALVGTLACIGLASINGARRAVTAPRRDFCVATALMIVGLCIYGMTSTMFNDPIVGYFAFWFGGIAVTLAQKAPVSVAQRRPGALNYA